MNVILILLLSILLTACGQSKKTTTTPTTTTKKSASLSEDQISSIINNQNFECSPIEGTECPEGLARLLILDKKNDGKSTFCTGFLVGEDILITNNHCINNQITCDNSYVAIYNGYSYEINRCDRILKTLTDYSNPNDPKKKLDVSIVKLKNRFFGKTFKFANTKPSYYDSLTVWVVDHIGLDRSVPNFVEARLTEFNCTFSPDAEIQSMVLERCPVIAGNSGSPVLNSFGEVVGIVWGGTLPDYASTRSLRSRRLLFQKAIATDYIYFKDYVP